MSFLGAMNRALPVGRHRVLGSSAGSAAPPLPTVLIGLGALGAGVSLLGGLALSRCGMLTLGWIKCLPISTCAGLAAMCLGVSILSIRALRDPICQKHR